MTNCRKGSVFGSDKCEVHGGLTIHLSSTGQRYIEWDEDHWHDRKKVVRKAYNSNNGRIARRALADMVIHAHDIHDE